MLAALSLTHSKPKEGVLLKSPLFSPTRTKEPPANEASSLCEPASRETDDIREGERELSGGKETERLLNGRAGEGEGGSVVESAESHALMSLYFNFIHQTTETDSLPDYKSKVKHV